MDFNMVHLYKNLITLTFIDKKRYGNYKVWVTSDPMDLSGRNKI